MEGENGARNLADWFDGLKLITGGLVRGTRVEIRWIGSRVNFRMGSRD